MYTIGEHVLRAVYLTSRPDEHNETPNSEGCAWVRPPTKIIDDSLPNILVRTAFAKDDEGYNCSHPETDMDNESRGLHPSQKPSEIDISNQGDDNE